MYYNTGTGDFGLSEGDVRSYFEQAGMLVTWPEPFAPREPFVAVIPAERPAYNPATHKAVEIAPKDTPDGWLQQWKAVKLSAAELAQIEADRLAAEQAEKDAARITVTKRQALLALFDLKGIKGDQIDAMISTIPDENARYRAKVDWDGSAAIESDSPTMLMLAAGLELNKAALEQLFDYARAL